VHLYQPVDENGAHLLVDVRLQAVVQRRSEIVVAVAVRVLWVPPIGCYPVYNSQCRCRSHLYLTFSWVWLLCSTNTCFAANA
jgi:hypothetical protein